jgi:phosphoribosylaminoimidazole-succinocarboxamide synthase
MERERIQKYLGREFPGFGADDFPAQGSLTTGKVRDILDLGEELVIATSDRISAFDRVLTVIPCKGQVLNGMAMFWFDKTADIISNHVIEVITERTVKVRKCEVLPVEVVVRGYLTGSAWRDYAAGNSISGIELPGGMRMNEKFEEPIITPSTKAERGSHDEPISGREVVDRGLVDGEMWREVTRTALALFTRGTRIAADRGLILVDTKYEFGLSNGKLVLVDEVHTPDSSRFWYADTYGELYEKNETQRILDKEYLRQWLMERGFKGDGEAPHIPDEVRVETAWRYVQAYETITGESFEPADADPAEELAAVRSALSL